MILYKDNPDLKLRVVTTIKNDKEYRLNCKCIGGKFYLQDRDCFYIESEEKWYRLNESKICFDHETNKWVLRNTIDLCNGIVKFENGLPILGFFTKNKYNNVSTRNYTAINSTILLENNYFEDIGRCTWFNRNEIGDSDYKKMCKIRNEVNHHSGRGYTIEENPNDFENKKESYKNYSTKIDKEVLNFGKLIGDLTFG